MTGAVSKRGVFGIIGKLGDAPAQQTVPVRAAQRTEMHSGGGKAAGPVDRSHSLLTQSQSQAPPISVRRRNWTAATA
jgi:hypothetical protein